MRLKPSPWRHIMLVALSGIFVVLGLLIAKDHSILGWFTVAFFGLGVLVEIVTLVPGSSYLELSSSGITVRTLYRTWHVNWSDVSDFFVSRVGGRDMVCWNYSSSYSASLRGRKISRSLAGVEAGLPDTFGLSATELANLLNQWRMEHTGCAP